MGSTYVFEFDEVEFEGATVTAVHDNGTIDIETVEGWILYHVDPAEIMELELAGHESSRQEGGNPADRTVEVTDESTETGGEPMPLASESGELPEAADPDLPSNEDGSRTDTAGSAAPEGEIPAAESGGDTAA